MQSLSHASHMSDADSVETLLPPHTHTHTHNRPVLSTTAPVFIRVFLWAQWQTCLCGSVYVPPTHPDLLASFIAMTNFSRLSWKLKCRMCVLFSVECSCVSTFPTSLMPSHRSTWSDSWELPSITLGVVFGLYSVAIWLIRTVSLWSDHMAPSAVFTRLLASVVFELYSWRFEPVFPGRGCVCVCVSGRVGSSGGGVRVARQEVKSPTQSERARDRERNRGFWDELSVGCVCVCVLCSLAGSARMIRTL